MRSAGKVAPLAAAVALVSAALGLAQVTTATLYGIVADRSGAVLPGAEVTLTHRETAAVRQTLSGETGEFVFTTLPVGSYTLKISVSGFKTYIKEGIELAAGQNARQTYALEVGGVAETVTVQGSAPLVNAVSPEQRESLGTLQVRELPLGRRNITNILRLSTGVDIAGGGARSVRINGVGKHGTGISVDGTDANANPEGRGLSTYQETNYVDVMSIDAVQEVQVLRGILAAEYGGVAGGQVNLISKSGSNSWHGSAFNNYQSHIFNARHPYVPRLRADGSEIPKPRVVFNQFGGSLGGPIVRDRAFIFGVYEGYRESNFATVSVTTPTQQTRDEILRALPFPETKIALGALPLPTEPHPRNPDLGFFVGARNTEARENHFLFKGDVLGWLKRGSTLSLTYSRNRPYRLIPTAAIGNDRFWQTEQDRVSAFYVMGGSRWTSETRFGWNYSHMMRVDQLFDKLDPKSSKEESPWGRRVARFSVSGYFSTPDGELYDMEGPTYSFDQKYGWQFTRHLVKFGGRYFFYGGMRTNPELPKVNFLNKADLLANVPVGTNTTFGAPPHKSRMFESGLFIQDDWRVNNRLVLNLGLRYDFYSNNVVEPTTDVPAGITNLSPPRDWSKFDFGPPRPLDKPYEHDGWANLGPRFGFAYNVLGNGKTVVRGGFGVLFSPQMPIVPRQGAADPVVPFRVQWSAAEAASLGVKWPYYTHEARQIVNAQAAKEGKIFVFSVLNPNLQNPYTMHYQLNVQRELTPATMFEIGYVGVRGVKFIMHRVPNIIDRVTGLRPNPNLALGGYYVDNTQNSDYGALQASVRRRFSRSLSFDAHYTWGKGLATMGGDIGAYYQGDVYEVIQDFSNPRADRGPTTGDARHRVAADWIYQLPSLSNKAFLRNAIGGWQVSGIILARSGEPIFIGQSGSAIYTRPDYVGGDTVLGNWRQNLVPGARCVAGANCPVQYLNPSAFAKVPITDVAKAAVRPGSAGTSLVRGPAAWTVDLGLGKEFRIREQVRLEVRADMFNALNHVNYGGPNTDVSSPFFGQIRGAQGMRTMQMGARLTF